MKTEIDQLLNKYLRGETELEEEARLEELLRSTDDSSYDQWKEYFSVLKSERQTKIPDQADEALLQEFNDQTVYSIREMGELKKWLAIAASLLLIFFAGQWAREYDRQQWKQSLTEDSYESSEAAIYETQKALSYFSTKYQKGLEISSRSLEETKYIDRHFDFNSH